jgi:nitronate monooxygenase
MAGGPTTVELVAAASKAGALAFVAGAYKSAVELATEVRAVSIRAGGPLGVNVFVPGRPIADPSPVTRYAGEIEADARRLGVALGPASWDDDDWNAKVELLTEVAPAVASFAFGCPPRAVIEALQRRGSTVMVTVTSVVEADVAIASGAALLCAQGIEAGAHRGCFDDTAPDDELGTLRLVRAIASRHRVPVVAAGGIGTPRDVRAALAAGAVAVQAGTAFLRSDEAGTSPTHRAALADPRFTTTALTRAFTGRRARGLLNRFMTLHPSAPTAFPEIHHLMKPLRLAASRAGDAERTNLWAGTGYRHSRQAPAGDIVQWLASEIDL